MYMNILFLISNTLKTIIKYYFCLIIILLLKIKMIKIVNYIFIIYIYLFIVYLRNSIFDERKNNKIISD